MANYIEKNDDKLIVSALTDEDVRTVIALSKDERIAEKVLFVHLTPSLSTRSCCF